MRTEEEIFEDFKKLGCSVDRVEDSIFINNGIEEKSFWLDIEIVIGQEFVFVFSTGIPFVFIPLLNELLECVRLENEN